MGKWIIRYWANESGKSPIEKWLDKLTKEQLNAVAEELSKLEELHISNTDINEVDIEKLPKSLNYVYYSTEERPKSKLKDIERKLDSYNPTESREPLPAIASGLLCLPGRLMCSGLQPP